MKPQARQNKKCTARDTAREDDSMEYTVIRSKRKTLGLEVKSDGRVIVRAPLRLPEKTIRQFVNDHEAWIQKHIELAKEKREAAAQIPKMSEEEIRALAEKAMAYIPQRVAYYAPKIGVTYGRITIRNQKTRWGSCSAKGNLNFNCLLMLTPPEVIDSVVVHELCHRKEMNHSGKFYEEIERVFPEYKEWHGWLKKNGASLLARML